MESAFPRVKLAKRSHLQLIPNGWRITQGTELKRRILCSESCCYNKSHADPKLTASLRLDEHRPFFVAPNPCLTFLSITYMPFIFNQVYSFVHVYP
jgi:hypothetical protein